MRTIRTMRFMLCVLSLALAACSVSATPTATSTATYAPTATPSQALVALPCTPPSPIHDGPVGTEVEGTASPSGQQLWGLLQALSPLPLHAQEGIKIVWRMTGSGGFCLLALGPQGQQVRPTSGPEPHLGSNWNDHPGDEWGSLFQFPTAGCWDIRATRDDATGDVLLVVAS